MSRNLTETRPATAPLPSVEVPRRAPLVERIVAWSITHRWKAFGGWLLLVAIAVLLSAMLPGSDALATDPGDSGRAGTALRAQESHEPSLENVLVQGTGMQAATDDLVATLNAAPGAVSDVRTLESANGSSALVAFFVAGPSKQVSRRCV